MKREKRSAKVQVYVPPNTLEQLELFRAEDGVISLSDYLHRVVDEHIVLRIAKQKIGRRLGNQ